MRDRMHMIGTALKAIAQMAYGSCGCPILQHKQVPQAGPVQACCRPTGLASSSPGCRYGSVLCAIRLHQCLSKLADDTFTDFWLLVWPQCCT